MRREAVEPTLPGLPTGSRFLPELEGLRGLAIALVFALHLDFYLGGQDFLRHDLVSLAYAFVRSGHTGVSLFFLLSGFLITRPFLEERIGISPRVSLRDYAVNRALRVLPLFWAVMLFATLWTARIPADLTRALPYLTLTFAFVPASGSSLAPFSHVWWSLATEIQFYSVLPLLHLVLCGAHAVWLGAALFLLWAGTYGTFLWNGFVLGAHPMTVGHSLIGRAPMLMLGAAIAWLWLRHGPRLRARLALLPWLRRGGGDLILVGLIVAQAVLLRRVAARSYFLSEMPPQHAWHLAEGALWGGVMLALLVLPLRLRGLVVNPLMTRLGLLSYSIYLVHMPVLHAVFHALPRLRAALPAPGVAEAVTSALAIGTTLGISLLTFALIERPFLRRKDHRRIRTTNGVFANVDRTPHPVSMKAGCPPPR